MQRYFEQSMPGELNELGNLPAGMLLDFFLEEIGPLLYNRGVADAQERMQARLMDLPAEVYADGFQYWARQEAQRKYRR